MSPKPYLQRIELRRDEVPSFNEYPFNIPVIKQLKTLEFHPDVTFIIGENGTGKSTLIEAIAYVMGMNPEGGNKNTRFTTQRTHSELHDYLKRVRSYKYPKDFYFLRAESFYNLATFVDGVGGLYSYGGKSLHKQSHGESFMSVMNHKLRGNGFYVMDEPESALSPTRQMSALIELDRLVKKESQFIIVTHSPILLSYPRAKIYEVKEGDLTEVTYTQTEHYEVTRNFLNRYEVMLEQLHIL